MPARKKAAEEKPSPATLATFERALRRALNTPPENPRKKTTAKRKKKGAR